MARAGEGQSRTLVVLSSAQPAGLAYAGLVRFRQTSRALKVRQHADMAKSNGAGASIAA